VNDIFIHWCEICNERPATGILTVIRKGEIEPTLMHACTKCVDGLDETDWIEHNDLC